MKLKIKDRSGKIYRVTDEAPAAPAPKKACRDADDLDKDEIALLKKLVPHIEELIGLLKVEQEEHDEESFDAEEVEADEESEETAEEEFVEDDACSEEVEETEEEEEAVEKIHDSKKAFGAIERKKVTDSDPELLQADEIALAWEKRYGGK